MRLHECHCFTQRTLAFGTVQIKLVLVRQGRLVVCGEELGVQLDAQRLKLPGQRLRMWQ